MDSITAHFIDTSAETYLAAGEVYRQHLRKEAENNCRQNFATRKKLAQKLCRLRKKMRQRSIKTVAEQAALVCARHLFNIHRRTSGFINRLKRDSLELCLNLCGEFLMEIDCKQTEILAQQIRLHLEQSPDPSGLSITLRPEELPELRSLLPDVNINFLTTADLQLGCCEIHCAGGRALINWRRNLATISSRIRAYARQKYPD